MRRNGWKTLTNVKKSICGEDNEHKMPSQVVGDFLLAPPVNCEKKQIREPEKWSTEKYVSPSSVSIGNSHAIFVRNIFYFTEMQGWAMQVFFPSREWHHTFDTKVLYLSSQIPPFSISQGCSTQLLYFSHRPTRGHTCVTGTRWKLPVSFSFFSATHCTWNEIPLTNGFWPNCSHRGMRADILLGKFTAKMKDDQQIWRKVDSRGFSTQNEQLRTCKLTPHFFQPISWWKSGIGLNSTQSW